MGAKKKYGKRARKTASNHAQFVDEYLANGRNASAAYRKLHPRASERTASVAGAKYIANHSIQRLLTEREKEINEKAGLTLVDTLRQLRCVKNFDLRKMYNADGTVKAPHELDDDTAAALASLDTDELFDGAGKDRKLIGYSRKFRTFDKVRAIDMAMKHFGQYEIDNKQKADAVADLLAAVDQRGAKPTVRE